MTDTRIRETLAKAMYNIEREVYGADPWEEYEAPPAGSGFVNLHHEAYQRADAALKVFREWLGSEAISEPLYVAPKNTRHWDGYSEGWASALVRLATLASTPQCSQRPSDERASTPSAPPGGKS